MSFEMQELPDIIRLIVLLILSEKRRIRKPLLKKRINMICQHYTCIDISDLDDALMEMASEGLIRIEGDVVHLTNKGLRLSGEWRSLFLKEEPIIEVVAGITDGSTTGLLIVLSTFIAGLTSGITFARCSLGAGGGSPNEFLKFPARRDDGRSG